MIQQTTQERSGGDRWACDVVAAEWLLLQSGGLELATDISSGVGPWMIGLMEDAVGSYELPLTVTALLRFAAALPVWFARARRQPSDPPSIIARPAPQRGRFAG